MQVEKVITGRIPLKILIKQILMAGLAFFLLLACEKKEKQSFSQDELTKEELALLEEPDLESVELDDDFADEEYAEDPEEEIDDIETTAKSKKSKKSTKKASKASKTREKEPVDVMAGSQNIETDKSGRYVIQVGIFAAERKALGVVNRLVKDGIQAYATAVKNPVPDMVGTHYRVRVGFFPSIEEANNYANRILVPRKYSFWIDLKSNDQAVSVSKRKSPPPPKRIVMDPPKPKTVKKESKISKMTQIGKKKLNTQKKSFKKPAPPADDDWGDDMDGDDWELDN